MSSDSLGVARILGKRGISEISKGELERAILLQYKAVAELLMELYCCNPRHRIFKDSPKEQMAPYEAERRKRMVSVLRRILRAVRCGK